MTMFLATAAISALIADVPPTPVAEPFTEQKFGIAIEDPYRWMEAPERAGEVRDWLVKSGEYARTELAKVSKRDDFAKLIDQATRAGVSYRQVLAFDDRLFYLKREPNERVAKLVVREKGTERTLFDPELGDGRVAAVSRYSLSPDGKTLAFHVAEGGGEIGDMRFLDVESGREKAPRLGPIWGEFEVRWLSPTAFTYVRMAERQPGVDPLLNMKAYLLQLGEEGPGTPLLGAGVPGAPAFDPLEFPSLSTSEISPWVVGVGLGARADVKVLLAHGNDVRQGAPKWRLISNYDDRINDYALSGDDIYFLSSKENSSGRLLKGSLKDADLKLHPIMDGGDVILKAIVTTADGLYVRGTKDGAGRLFFQAKGSEQFREVLLPFEATIVRMISSDKDRSLILEVTGWMNSMSYFLVRQGRVQSIGAESAIWGEAAKNVVMRDEAVSADGTHVPMAILMPSAGLPPEGRPTILSGYGGYGINLTGPSYSPYNMTWLRSGGIVAFCGTRGGGEKGRDWHEGGRAANKPNAHADFIACAERLVEKGYAKASQIVASSASMGGTLVPLATLKRPDLFTAQVVRVAMLNASRLDAVLNGANQYAEAGDPRTEQGFHGLVAQDAYLALAKGKDIPDTLLTVGLNDNRVSPFESAKFGARAQALFHGRRSILIRSESQDGHGVGSALDVKNQEFADIFAFAWDQATKE